MQTVIYNIRITYADAQGFTHAVVVEYEDAPDIDQLHLMQWAEEQAERFIPEGTTFSYADTI